MLLPETANSLGFVSNGVWTSLPGSIVDPNAHTVQAPISVLPPFFSPLTGNAWPVFNVFSDGDPSKQLGAFGSLTLCVGDVYTLGVFGGTATLQVSSNNPTVATAVPSIVVGSAFIRAISPGLARITTSDLGITSTVSVIVEICAASASTGFVITEINGSADNIFLYRNGSGSPTSVTSAGNARYPGFGVMPAGGASGTRARLSAPDVTPMAYRATVGSSYNETIYWNGLSGAATIVTPPANSNNLAAAFVDNGPFLFAPNVGGSSEIWGVPVGGNTATKMTNLGGSMFYLATSPDGNVYMDWVSLVGGAVRHIYRLPTPTLGGTVPTSGQVQMSPTVAGVSETQPAVAAEREASRRRGIDGATFARVYVLDMSKPGATPQAVSPATGFSFTPAFCGNGNVYFAYSTSLSGNYTVYVWNAGAGTAAPVAGLAGISVADLAIARSDGDGGLHVCP